MTVKSVLLCIVIYLCLSLQAWYSASNALQVSLIKNLPSITNASLVNAIDEQQELNRISKQLMSTLALIEIKSSIGIQLIKQLHISKLTLHKATQKNLESSTLFWPFGEHFIAMNIATKPYFNFINIAILSILLTLLSLFLERMLNKLCSRHQLTWRNILTTYGLDNKQATQIAESLSTDEKSSTIFELLSSQTQLAIDDLTSLCQDDVIKALAPKQQQWLITAINNGLTITDAIAVAKQSDSIAFDLNNQQVIIHGLPIRLAKTPLFYYYWYALREVEKLPPYLNPPPNKPDRVSGQQLAQLMADYKGHQKAIKDLKEEGLKGKTLDQNRNKIKAELHKILGELAKEYLFISERDIKTARYKYRLDTNNKSVSV